MLNALLEPFRMVVITAHHNPVWYRYEDLVEGLVLIGNYILNYHIYSIYIATLSDNKMGDRAHF